MATTISRRLDAMPDTLDFRDNMYVPSLIEVPPVSNLELYRSASIPVLDQGEEGACTGFGLATVANYLLSGRGRRPVADEVSAWMLYAMAKRYDEWPGEKYEGSSARGAVKGWHKHGVCALRIWKDMTGDADLDEVRAADSLSRPLGAYFRVNHKDLVAMHAAINEVGALYATARVHSGWQQVATGDEEIRFESDLLGGHAFAIVGYDREGFWIQNSWGRDWGSGGLARLGYADWLANGTDVWVASLGVPVELGSPSASATLSSGAPRSYEGYVYSALRPHIITAKNDGALDSKGSFGLTREGLKNILTEQMPKRMEGWTTRRLVLHAHGGLVPQAVAVQYVANNRQAALDAEAYPISFVWRSDAWSTIRNILKEAMSRRRDEGLLDKAKDFMLDRLDDMLEPVARYLGGKAMWDEMKENALGATRNPNGAARLTADHLVELFAAGKITELHLVAHSAGAIFMSELAGYLAEHGIRIASLSLWAPAMTIELFERSFARLLAADAIGAFDLYTLDDATERDDDCAGIYHKSLLYLVSAALEAEPRIPLIQDGTPLLGLARDVADRIPDSFWNDSRRWYLAPRGEQSDARHHGDFDNDGDTLASTLFRITGHRPASDDRSMSSAEGLVRKRQAIDHAIGARVQR
jgi:hypothetical protein